MLTRRRLLKVEESKLLFFAPFSENKYPVYAWDGNMGLFYEGGSVIQNGYLMPPGPEQANRIVFGCKAPIEKDITISALHYADSWTTGNLAFSMAAMPNVQTSVKEYPYIYSCMYAKHRGQFTNQTVAVYLESHPPLKQWILISMAIKKANDGQYTMSLYWNGVLKGAVTGNPPNYENYISIYGQPYISFGVTASSNNYYGRLKNYTVHELLNDEELAELTANQGVPKEFI